MIMSHLTHIRHTLLACSLTCYSWYIAAVPHLHHTLHADMWPRQEKYQWPNPLRNARKLGLLPLVKRFRIHSINCGISEDPFSPKGFSLCTLRQFSRLTNVRELEIDGLDTPGFISKARRYFGHFLPTVRSLLLRAPRGSRRQIIFFIGLFQHLEDLTLLDGTLKAFSQEPVNDLTLIPSFAPPLRGRLVMARFTRIGFLKDMINLLGGIRFRYMDIFDVGEARLLLNACAQTLETVRLHPNDPRGEQLNLKCM